eukprot:882737-Pelagomonas_calceolata.AAC.2
MRENEFGKGSICRVFRDLQVLSSKTICATNVHGGKAYPKRAFAGTYIILKLVRRMSFLAKAN